MKKFFYRLVPVMSLLCLPLFGGYHPAATREGLHLEHAQLVAVAKNMAYQGVAITENYEITLIFPAPKKGLRDYIPGTADYRFFSKLTNFKPNEPITDKRVMPKTQKGVEYIDIHDVGQAPKYRASNTYPHYGRFYFETNMNKVHNFYGRALPLLPYKDEVYLAWVARDMYITARGIPTPGKPANPAGW